MHSEMMLALLFFVGRGEKKWPVAIGRLRVMFKGGQRGRCFDVIAFRISILIFNSKNYWHQPQPTFIVPFILYLYATEMQVYCLLLLFM